jgi:hypothetical protein
MSTNITTAAARGAGAARVLCGRSATCAGDLTRRNVNAHQEETMTMQMTRPQHESAEAINGSYALPAPQEATPPRDAVTAQLRHLAARIGRLEMTHADQQTAQRSEAVGLQVTISHVAPQGPAFSGVPTVRVHGPEVMAANRRRDRVRWPRYRAG